MALGYLMGKAAAAPFKLRVNAALLMVLSILPDMDLLLGGDFHRGPTHSLVVASLVFVPVFLAYRQRALPYFLALVSHGFADLGGEVQLFWPFSPFPVELPLPISILRITDMLSIAAEMVLFVGAFAVLALTGDYRQFLRRKLTNLTLIVPLLAVAVPALLAFPLEVPALLMPVHVVFLLLFAVAVALSF